MPSLLGGGGGDFPAIIAWGETHFFTLAWGRFYLEDPVFDIACFIYNLEINSLISSIAQRRVHINFLKWSSISNFLEAESKWAGGNLSNYFAWRGKDLMIKLNFVSTRLVE